MARLEELAPDAAVRGITHHGLVTIVNIKWHGSDIVEIFYKDNAGRVGTEIIYRDDEARLEVVSEGQPWQFDADGDMLRLVSEAQRIRMAYLFDPFLAVHTSIIDPLPHQITAVYERMLPRQPLRFLLADDPGAGKTIMAGLFIKELLVRGDLKRCLIVCPGSLVEQWQDELYRRFHLPFEILTNDSIESARSGNAFTEKPLLIARLDKLARDEDLQARLQQTDWDLVIVDEAHKMSASFNRGEVSYTKRYHLGQLLGQVTRHLLLMTATPHNGKEEDFQLFLALLDGDRFEGRFRDGVHVVDVGDLMRRLPKEQLLKFDGRPLFPERLAYTVPYALSDMEAVLYHEVTGYVREEFNRADALESDGRKGTIGFALTILQRRLASSPEAIYQSLRRRRERLERRLSEEELLTRGARIAMALSHELTPDDLDDWDDRPAEETEVVEEQLVDEATAARTLDELRAEISSLKQLEDLALALRLSGTDRKWEELSNLLQNQAEMFDAEGYRRKLVIFTEHRDTLNYLATRIRSLLGRPEAVVEIHGSLRREERRKAQERFTQDKEVQILVATDAAGEGINLQRAHLMINYDLPWNPNRLEQRFGRIHRIGQIEVCHMWNLLAEETREGDVYLTLLHKLEREREALGGAVFDVLGRAINGAELRQLMIEAVRYGDRPDVRARLTQEIEGKLDREKLQALLTDGALAQDVMDAGMVQRVRLEMERVEARRLQPHFIAAFFREAFAHLGGRMRERETGRYEITHVPATIRQRDRLIGVGDAVQMRYERICFDRRYSTVQGKPMAEFICPGHPLLDATIDLILERYRDLMRQGAVLVDDNDPGEEPRALLYLEHSIQDGRANSDGTRRVVSRRLQFVELPLMAPSGEESEARDAGAAPYLDYRPIREEEAEMVKPVLQNLLASREMEQVAMGYAIRHIVPAHLGELRRFREPLVDRTRAAVHDRLTKEINYWDYRALDLKAQEAAGRTNAKMNSALARQRADDLQARLRARMTELDQERQISALPPVAVGGALVVPAGLLSRLRGARTAEPTLFARETKRVEQLAMETVMAAERALGYRPRDVSGENVGYDIESVVPGDPPTGDRLRLIEVKGRVAGAETVTVTKNEILTALNRLDNWILALVQVPPVPDLPADVYAVCERSPGYGAPDGCVLRYVIKPFTREPDFGATSVNYVWRELWERGVQPTSGGATTTT